MESGAAAAIYDVYASKTCQHMYENQRPAGTYSIPSRSFLFHSKVIRLWRRLQESS